MGLIPSIFPVPRLLAGVVLTHYDEVVTRHILLLLTSALGVPLTWKRRGPQTGLMRAFDVRV